MKTNLTFLEALRKIRPRYLPDGNGGPICWALGNIGCYRYRVRIMRQLGQYDTYTGWIWWEHRPFLRRKRIRDWPSDQQVRPGRLAWIDDMIAREVAKGRK